MMKMNVEIAGQHYRADYQRAISIAIPLHFNGKQPACFGSTPAHVTPLRAGDFIGDVNQGGSCNVPVISLNIHCNGTHTESISHIIDEVLSPWSLAPTLCPATLVSIVPTPSGQTKESYTPTLNPSDQVITAQSLKASLDEVDDTFLQALVIRTIPNGIEKCEHDYYDATFFTRDAMHYLSERGVLHLLVDFPSIDRMSDDGHLTAHHLFWGVPEDSHQQVAESLKEATVTELIYVPPTAIDGPYLLNLQIPAFELDAAPSRPVLIPLHAEKDFA